MGRLTEAMYVANATSTEFNTYKNYSYISFERAKALRKLNKKTQ